MNSKLVHKLSEYKKVLIIGPYPPPLGGVSVHIYRLHKILNNSKVFDLSQKRKFKSEILLKIFKEIIDLNYCDVIHIHAFNWKIIGFIMLLMSFKKFSIIATIHNPRLFEANNFIEKYIFKVFLRSLDVLVVVGSHILEDYKKRKIKLPKEVIVEPAFLPPPKDEEKIILETYPFELFRFMQIHNPLVIANASQIVFDYNGVDLYGLDMCIEVILKLNKKYPDIGFVFALANKNENKEYLEKMKKRIKKLGIENNFFFLTGQKELWPLFKKVDLMIRPTTTDGDAISIREALYFDCPAIASDVCRRPDGTILFQNRNLDGLSQKIIDVLNAKN